MTRIVYDTGALIAAEADNRLLWSLHRAAVRRGHATVVPAGVLAQAWRGGPQPNLSRFPRGTETGPMDDNSARAVGALCARASTSDVVDASVVVASMEGDVIVTSDPGDLAALTAAAGLRVTIHPV